MKKSPWDRARPTCWRRSRKRDRSAGRRATDRGRPRRAGALPQHGGGGDRGRAGASRPAVAFAETRRRKKSRRRLTFNADLQRLSTISWVLDGKRYIFRNIA